MTANSCVTHSRSRRVTSAGNFIPCIRIICIVKMRKSDIIQLGAQPTLKTHFVVQTQTERQATLKRGHRLTWIHERMCACLCLCLCILKTWARHPFSPASSRWFAAELQYINIWTCYAAHSAHQRSRAGAHRMQESFHGFLDEFQFGQRSTAATPSYFASSMHFYHRTKTVAKPQKKLLLDTG